VAYIVLDNGECSIVAATEPESENHTSLEYYSGWESRSLLAAVLKYANAASKRRNTPTAVRTHQFDHPYLLPPHCKPSMSDVKEGTNNALLGMLKKTLTIMNVTVVNGGWMKKHHRHVNLSVRRPPMSGALKEATASVAPPIPHM